MIATNWHKRITRHDWVGKLIQWELCKELKLNHTDKCYKHPKSALENEKKKILKDFEIQIDHQIPIRRADLVLINKINNNKKRPSVN